MTTQEDYIEFIEDAPHPDAVEEDELISTCHKNPSGPITHH